MPPKTTYYTPEEYKTAFNEPWGERDAVYFVDYADTNDVGVSRRFWSVGTLGDTKQYIQEAGGILCATTHCPPDNYFHGGQ